MRMRSPASISFLRSRTGGTCMAGRMTACSTVAVRAPPLGCGRNSTSASPPKSPSFLCGADATTSRAIAMSRYSPSAPGFSGRQIDDQIVLLERHRKRLDDVGSLGEVGAALDRHRELPRAHGARVAPRLAGTNLEFPAVPR